MSCYFQVLPYSMSSLSFFLSPSNERARNENDHARDRRWAGDWRNLSTRGFAPLTKSEGKKETAHSLALP